MRAMKDSGIEWIGEIPQTWDVERLKYHAEFNPATTIPSMADDDQVSFIPMDHLKTGFHLQTTAAFGKVKKGYVAFAENDILMAKVTPCLENGNLAIATDLIDGFGFGSTEINVIRCRSINNRYMYYLLQSPSFIEKATYNMFGVAGLKRLVPEFIPTSFFPIPSQAEQERIASYLDAKCAEIDALIAAKEKTNALLRERRQSIIYEAVTKGLDPAAPMKDSGIDWIGQIPEGWKTIRAKYVVTITNGCDPKEEGDIPVYGSGAESFRTCGEYKEGPAVLIGRKGATLHIPHYIVGRYWNVDTAFDVKTDETVYLLKYYYYASVCFDYKLYISTTTLPSMTQTNYGNMFLPLPSVEEQQEIVDFIDNTLKSVDGIIATNDTTIQRMKEYRQSLIYEAVTGKIEV